MPLQNKAVQKIKSFDLPVSYKVNETRPRLRDALNVFSNQGRLETRFGRSLYNTTSLSGSVLSLSYFKTASGVRYILAKVGTVLYAVNSSGAHTAVKTGLSSTTKHRGITWARGSSSRHIISCESDGLFQFDGTTFTALGQSAPVAPTVAKGVTSGSIANGTYKAYLTYYSSVTGFESNATASANITISSQVTIQDLTYTAKLNGALGDLIKVTYTAGGTLGAETVAVTNNSINVTMANASTTANQIKSIIDASAAASALVDVTVSGTGTTAQNAVAATALSNGTQSIALTNIPTTATNATIDKIRIYFKLASSVDDAVYVTEIALGTSTYTITATPDSTTAYPLANAAPISGGGKFLTEFNRKLVYAGNNNFKNDVLFSEEDLPDAFNDGTAGNRLVLSVPFDGEITGIARGQYNQSVLDPYLVIFKKRSTHIYSEINGEGKFVPISKEIGCVSHETISIKNGNVFFLSDQGWRAIENGRIVVNSSGNPATLGDGDLNDIFRQPGYVYEINRAQLNNAFSVYYSTLDQYMTWVTEGSDTNFSKAYVYEFQLGGFKPYNFYSPSTCACVGEDSSGDEVVFMADSTGAIYTHSIKEQRSDDDSAGNAKSIDCFAMLTWMDGEDMDASYNFRELILERVYSASSLTVKTWVNYSMSKIMEYVVDFDSPDDGAVWDTSVWDEAIWSDERSIVTGRKDINRCGINILIGFYQNELNGNINLVRAQLEFNKNGNRN